MKNSTLIGLIVAGAVVAVPTCSVINHVMKRSEQTRDIGTADFVLENYRWFKNEEAAINQVNAQMGSTQDEITNYRKNFGVTPFADWPFDAREELARKEAVLRGYTSQYNKLVGEFNARKSDFTRGWTKGETPENIKPFLDRQYSPK